MQPNGRVTGMTDGKPAWPKTADGTTDWETVFEHPSNGLLPLVAEARSARALHGSAVAIVRMLHTREGDEAVTKVLLADLDRLAPPDLPAEKLAEARESVIEVLRGIKRRRVLKAKAYVRKKARMAARGGKLAERRQRQGRTRTAGWVAAALATVALLGLASWLVTREGEPDPEWLVDEIVATIVTPTPHAHVFGGTLSARTVDGRVRVTAQGVPRGMCLDVAWRLTFNGVVEIDGRIPERVNVASFTRTCDRTDGPAELRWTPFDGFVDDVRRRHADGRND